MRTSHDRKQFKPSDDEYFLSLSLRYSLTFTHLDTLYLQYYIVSLPTKLSTIDEINSDFAV